jgi:hypothetical protein
MLSFTPLGAICGGLLFAFVEFLFDVLHLAKGKTSVEQYSLI